MKRCNGCQEYDYEEGRRESLMGGRYALFFFNKNPGGRERPKGQKKGKVVSGPIGEMRAGKGGGRR